MKNSCIIKKHSKFRLFRARFPALVISQFLVRGGSEILHFFMFFWLLAAALCDLVTHKVPNIWILTGVTAGAAGAVLSGGWEPILFLLRILAVLFLLSPLFVLRMMGAGDLKVISVISGFLGIREGVVILAIALCLAAPLCLLQLLYRRNLKQRLLYFFVYFRQLFLTKQKSPYFEPQRDGYKNTIPFAVFLLAGTVWFRILTGR